MQPEIAGLALQRTQHNAIL